MSKTIIATLRASLFCGLGVWIVFVGYSLLTNWSLELALILIAAWGLLALGYWAGYKDAEIDKMQTSKQAHIDN